MKRVCGPSEGLVQIDTPQGRRLDRQRDGTFHLSDRNAKALVKEGGFIVPDMGVATSPEQGYRCVDCGFGTWFTTCGKCGGECHRETSA